MPGTTISRWTLSYFAAALAFLVLAEAAMAAGFGGPGITFGAPETLALTHLVTIGWLSLTICGALTQFVPVLVARPLAFERLPLPALLSLIAGLVLLTAGFLQLGGRIATGLPLLSAAAVVLACGFGLVIINIAATLWRARPLPLPARFVVVGLSAAVATVAFGALFALVLDGNLSGAVPLRLTPAALPLHVAAGLGGWLTLTAAGVSYRLLSMFMLAPDLDRAGSRAALRCAAAAQLLVVIGGGTAVLLDRAPGVALTAAMLTSVAAIALYGRDVVTLYRRRQRRALELNSRMAAVAVGHLALAAVLALILTAAGQSAAHADALVFLVAFGWLSGLIIAKLPKIVAFLTWLERYGPLLGRVPTPRVQDLVDERRLVKWMMLFFVAADVGVVALLVVAPLPFRIAALALLIGTIGLAGELIRIRLLADVPAAMRPHGRADLMHHFKPAG